MIEENNPNDIAEKIDKLVGERIRKLRRNQGLSQSELADLSGVTYQQIHKYEHGINRLSAGRAAVMALVLGVPVAKLFEAGEIYFSKTGNDTTNMQMKVARYFGNIDKPQYRDAIYRFIRAMAEE